ncbi:MAG TPA: AsmA family protein, partial [Sphingobacteriaceae bacterium]|nr:AsmA family protein [Sphingobacteriaceae bacterium]
MKKISKIAAKILLWILGIVLVLVLTVYVLIRIPAVQQYVLRQVTAYLEKKIETPFRIGGIGLDLPKMLVLEDIYVEDQNGDTLLAGEKLRVDINMLKLFRNVVEIQRLDLIGVTAQINRHLPDETFNFAYILDAFTASDNNSAVQEPVSAPADSASPMVIDIDRINLERIRISYHDEVIGLSTQLEIGKLTTNIETFDLSGHMHFGVPRIEIEGLRGQLRQWTSEIPPDTTDTGPLPNIDLHQIILKNSDFAYINEDLKIDTRIAMQDLKIDFKALDLNSLEAQIEHFNIADGNISYKDGNQPRLAKGFDYGNINISGLQGELKDFYFSEDSISGNLTGLAARDHSGFSIRALRSQFIYTDQGVELRGLYAETPNTRIRDYIRIQYPSMEALTDNLEDIRVRADLQNSYLGMRDVLYFVPDLDTMQMMQSLLTQTIHVEGQVNGKLNDLHIPSLSISTLDQTVLQASADIRGLPDMNKLDLQLTVHTLASSRSDLEQLLPQGLLPDSIRLPDDLLLSGNFNGGLNGFVTALELRTSDGLASLTGTYDVTANPGGGEPDTSYQAQVALVDVNMGKILMQDSTLGQISFAAEIQGTGLDPKKANASFQGELIGLEAMGYHYQHLLLTAEASSGIIEVNAGSDDPNMDFDLEAQANLLGKYPKLELELMIDSINFKNLGLMEDEFRYHGLVTANLETADLDFLNGTLEIKNSS